MVDLEPGTAAPHGADASDYGAEITNGATEELRLRLARRMHFTDLLGSEGRPISPATASRCLPATRVTRA